MLESITVFLIMVDYQKELVEKTQPIIHDNGKHEPTTTAKQELWIVV